MFEPKDAIPMWQTLYNAICNEPYGMIFSWETLKNRTGYDIHGKHRGLVHQVNKKLLPDHKKCLISFRGIGYKIGTADEQINQANRRPKKARRQIREAIRELENVETKNLSLAQRNDLQAYLNKTYAYHAVLRKRTVKAIEQTEAAIKKTEKSQKEKMDLIKELNIAQTQMNKVREAMGLPIMGLQ